MKNNLITVLSCLALLFTMSCAARIKLNFLNDPYRSEGVSAPLTISDIEVTDARKHVDTITPIIPRFTLKKIGDTIVPSLTALQEKVIKDEIGQYAAGGTTSVRVKATVNECIKEYSMGFFNAREYASAKVTIELMDSKNDTRLFSTTGEANYEVKSTRADTAFLESLYLKALKTSIFKCFESVEGNRGTWAKEGMDTPGTMPGTGE